MTVTKEFATKIDTELADLYDKAWNLRQEILIATDSKKWYEKTDERKVQYASYIAELDAKIASAKAKLVPIYARTAELNAVYASDPWTRAYLVVSSDGHVHKDMYCSTCFNSTRYAWLVQYSNDDESTIVSDAGEMACTVCYPSAPAEVLNRATKIVTKEKVEKELARIAREEKRQAKIAKAKADAPTASGEPLRILNGQIYRGFEQYDEYRTERSAITAWYYEMDVVTWEVKQLAKNVDWDGTPFSDKTIEYKKGRIAKAQEKADIIADALAGKYEETYEAMVKILMAKYAKRNKQR